jgi:hypothetical protein
MKTLLKDDRGYIQFLIEVAEDVDHSMDFKVYEVNAWACDGKNTPCETELYIHGTIKWDGCSHVYFGECDEEEMPSGYLHLCGKRYWEKHNKMMTALWDLASVTVEGWDEDVAG